MSAAVSRWIEATAGANWTVGCLARLTVLLAAAWLVHAALRRANPRWRVLLWRGTAASALIVLLLSLVGPAISLAVLPPTDDSASVRPTMPREPITDSPAVIADNAAAHGPTLGRAPDSPPTPDEAPAAVSVPMPAAAAAPAIDRPWTIATYFWTVWGIGLLMDAVRESVAVARLGRLLRRAVLADAALVAQAADIAARLAWRKPFDLRFTSELLSPCVIGIWRPAILLPSVSGQQAAAGDLAAILAHEIQHLKNSDLSWNTLLRGLARLLWFHPLAWPMRSAHAAACDAVCDAAAADFTGDLAAYCRTLARLALRAAGPQPQSGLAMARASSVRRRIEALNRRHYVSGLPRWGVLIAILGSLVGAGLLGMTRLTHADSPEAEKQSASETKDVAKGDATAGKAAARGAIAGTVRDAEGRPIADAAVEIVTARGRDEADPSYGSSYPDCRKSATTDKDGHFSLDALDPSLLFDLAALVAGYRVQMIEKVDPLDGKSLDIKLEAWRIPDDPQLVVQGVVVDPEGKPVADAIVQPEGWLDDEARVFGGPPGVDVVAITDASGKFVLVGKKPVKGLDLRVIADGFARHYFELVPVGLNVNKLTLERGTTVQGRVIRAGQGVGGLKIGFAQANRASELFLGAFEAETDAEGRFTLSGLPAGEEMVAYGVMDSFRDVGALVTRHFTTVAEGTLNLADQRLERGYRVAGRIVLADGKRVPPHTRVIVSRPEAWDTMTIEVDADDHFVIRGVPGECISLSIAIAGYRPSPKNKSYDPSEHNSSLEGRVVDDIDNLIILCERESPQPDRFSLPAEIARARFNHTRTEPLEGVTEALEAPQGDKVIRLLNSEPDSLDAPAFPVPHIAMPAAPPAFPPPDATPAKMISGVVIDHDGKPVAGAQVWLPVQWLSPLETLTATARCDDQGRFRLGVPEAWFPARDFIRNWNLWAYAPGHAVGRFGAAPQPFGEIAGEGYTVKLPPASDVSVLITTPDGKPALGAKVATEPPEEQRGFEYRLPRELAERIAATTDADGRALLPALWRGWQYDLAVTLADYGEQAFHVELRPTDPPLPTLALRAVARVEGHFVTDQLDLVRGMIVTIESWPLANHEEVPLAHGKAVVRVDDEGRFVIPEFASGRLEINTTWDSRLAIRPRLLAMTNAVPMEGETIQIDFPLEACVRVLGVVRAKETGRPIVGAKVWVGDVNNRVGELVTTDENGAYSAYTLAAEWIVTQVRSPTPGFAQLEGHRDQFKVPRGRKEFTLAPIELLPTGSMGGTLLDADGKPLAGAQIHASIGRKMFYGHSDEKGAFALEGVPIGATPEVEFVQIGNDFLEVTTESTDPLVVRLDPGQGQK